MVPLVAIVGRPNTGKSTLFNRLVGSRAAIESSIPGTTRDRIFHRLDFNEDNSAILIDTGGVESEKKAKIEADVQEQTKLAISEASLIVLVLDTRENLTADDYYAAEILRKSRKPVILVANKCDNPMVTETAVSFFELGFGNPIAISSYHGIGIDELKDVIFSQLSREKLIAPRKRDVQKKRVIKLAIIGRPNVGKSTLINSLLNEKKLITSEIPGTTRDAVSHLIQYHENEYELVDTAGIRRRGSVAKGIEKFSVLRAIQAIEDADIVIWLLDISELVTHQDKQVISYALESFKGIIIAVNKSDLLKSEDRSREEILLYLQRQLPFLHFAPVVFISALAKINIFTLLDQAKEIQKSRQIMISERDFSFFLKKITALHLPQRRSKHTLKVISGRQVNVSPPRFLIRVNDTALLHFSYKRYLENQIRERYSFSGTAIQIIYTD